MITIKMNDQTYMLRYGTWTGPISGIAEIMNNYQFLRRNDYSPTYGEPEIWFASEVADLMSATVGEFVPDHQEPVSIEGPVV